MKPLSAFVVSSDPRPATALINQLGQSPLVETVVVLQPQDSCLPAIPGAIVLESACPPGGAVLSRALAYTRESPLLLVITDPNLELLPAELERLAALAPDSTAAMAYGDFYLEHRRQPRPVVSYQPGSIRDDFAFGPLQVYRRSCVDSALQRWGGLSESSWGGLYELRLKTSLAGDVCRLTDTVGCVQAPDMRHASHFAYVEHRQAAYQLEMEQLATAHLARIGACCTHPLRQFAARAQGWPGEASVVIPVRNRRRTIADAVRSALSQQPDFAFNVLVVDNHSTDGTTEAVAELARADRRVVHIVPPATGIGIGGCWNSAISSARCGRFVCQLDSDDLYADERTLGRMVALLQQGCGMAVGSYRLVDFDLRDIPPGIIDHREWTDENGRNNLLRVQGIGAPRAFATELLREHLFPDVSYGEDYAVSLRISRDYRIGRVYDPLYLCRRWEDNTDSEISIEQANRFAEYKDGLRTNEIEERIAHNRHSACSSG